MAEPVLQDDVEFEEGDQGLQPLLESAAAFEARPRRPKAKAKGEGRANAAAPKGDGGGGGPCVRAVRGEEASRTRDIQRQEMHHLPD